MKLSRQQIIMNISVAMASCCFFVTAFSYPRDIYAQSSPTTNRSRKVSIQDNKGISIYSLIEDDEGEKLLLLTSGKSIPCCSWEDKREKELPSPDGKTVAIVYVRNCGATTDFATRVDVSFNDENDPNTVFIVKGRHQINVEWDGNNTLVIKHPKFKKENIFEQKKKLSHITIAYHEESMPATETQYLQLANFNYGLTGLAAGQSEETLLRIAGWAQSKAGLTKNEWGTWYGNPPYGDDPNEQLYIEQGFEYYKLNKDKIEKTGL